eukprot:jgi/Mesvir1/23300/Mv20996-RA.1
MARQFHPFYVPPPVVQEAMRGRLLTTLYSPLEPVALTMMRIKALLPADVGPLRRRPPRLSGHPADIMPRKRASDHDHPAALYGRKKEKKVSCHLLGHSVDRPARSMRLVSSRPASASRSRAPRRLLSSSELPFKLSDATDAVDLPMICPCGLGASKVADPAICRVCSSFQCSEECHYLYMHHKGLCMASRRVCIELVPEAMPAIMLAEG